MRRSREAKGITAEEKEYEKKIEMGLHVYDVSRRAFGEV